MSGIPKASVFCEPVNAAATLGRLERKTESQEVSMCQQPLNIKTQSPTWHMAHDSARLKNGAKKSAVPPLLSAATL